MIKSRLALISFVFFLFTGCTDKTIYNKKLTEADIVITGLQEVIQSGDEFSVDLSIQPDFAKVSAYSFCIRLYSFPQNNTQCVYNGIKVYDYSDETKNIVNQEICFLEDSTSGQEILEKKFKIIADSPGKYIAYYYCYGYPRESSEYKYLYSKSCIINIE